MNIKKNSGFTIVELLIVIIVIAILATLVITAYNGVQVKAENTKTINVVEVYQKALIQYAIEHGNYPPYGCLGEGNPNNKCYAGQHSESISLNNSIRPYLGNKNPLPTPSTQKVNNYFGALFYTSSNSGTIDGQHYSYYLWYVLKGIGAKCPVGPLLDGIWPDFSSAPPGVGYSGALGQGSQCWVKMPDPEKL